MSSGYLMESDLEADRLEDKTDAEETRRQLLRIGIEPGQTVLDAGGGTGAVARVMANLVGTSGRAVCLDRSVERLAAGRSLAQREGITNLSFVAGDITSPPFERVFDVVWARFVLEYLREPVVAVRALSRALRSGGKLVVGDVDGHGLFLSPMTRTIEDGLGKLFRALSGRFDPFAGRKLYGYLLEAGLEDLEVHVVPYHLYAGVAPEDALSNWTTKFRVVRDAVIPEFANARAYDEFVAEYLAHLRSSETFQYSCLILAEGRVP